jgi:hypothetical protein
MWEAAPMVGFDAEGYLRVLGEEQLADQGLDSPFAGPIDHAAAALVAVGALSADDARAVLADYGAETDVDMDVGDGLAAGGCRVVALDAGVRLSSGTVRLSHARLGDDETVIVASYRADPEHAGVHHDWIRVPSGWPSGLQPLVLADDRRAKVALTFDGSGNDDRWQATLRAESPVAPDTAWIELCDVRIRCIEDRPAVRIAIEPLLDGNPAHAHLWRYLARSEPEFDTRALEASVDVLIACGAFTADDPVLRQFEVVRRELPRPYGYQTKASGLGAMPDPWRSVIQRRGHDDGPTGLVLIAATTPAFAGHRVAVDVLESVCDGFTVTARESPAPRTSLAFRGPVEDHDLVWWARDDRGNHYLAARRGDELRFATPLDPLAATLKLMPTAVDYRALITFSLRWVDSGV